MTALTGPRIGRGRRRSPDRGVTIVEAAIALPVLFLFVMGLVDLGMWTYNSNQSANAARDGARTAIVSHAAADIPASPDWNAIVDSIEAHLPGREIAPDQIDISCVRPDGSVVAGGCAAATVDVDRIRVEVEWDWDLVTPIAGVVGTQRGAATGEATMVIVGRPLATSPTTVPSPATTSTSVPLPPASTTTTTQPSSTTTTTAPPSTTTTTQPCPVSGLTVTAAQSKGNGSLQSDLAISFTTNGASSCAGLVIQVEAPLGLGSTSHTCGCGAGATQAWTLGKNAERFWAPGVGTVRIYRGSSAVATTTFTVL